MRRAAQVWRQYQTKVSVLINGGESVAVQVYGNFTREKAIVAVFFFTLTVSLQFDN